MSCSSSGAERIGCYPGSFDPPTIAHLAVAEAAIEAAQLDRVDLVVSRAALGKPAPPAAVLDERLTVLRAVAETRPWLGVVLTEHRLVVDLAQGYDAVIMGADKWRQVLDPAWYDHAAARDDALSRLPRVLVAPRADDDLDDPTPDHLGLALGASHVVVLRVELDHRPVSSSAIRAGLPGAARWVARP